MFRRRVSKGSRIVYAFMVYTLLWCIFIYSPNQNFSSFFQEILLGIFVAAILSILTYKFISEKGLANLAPRRIAYFLVYIPVFITAMIKANFDVAYRVLHPRRPIKPGIVRIRSNIKNPAGKLALANSITLTPGTLTMDIDEDSYYVHWIYVRSEEEEVAGEIIKGKFERYLKEVFD